MSYRKQDRSYFSIENQQTPAQMGFKLRYSFSYDTKDMKEQFLYELVYEIRNT